MQSLSLTLFWLSDSREGALFTRILSCPLLSSPVLVHRLPAPIPDPLFWAKQSSFGEREPGTSLGSYPSVSRRTRVPSRS